MFEEMTRSEQYAHRTVVRHKALEIVEEHGQTREEFFEEMGDRDSYSGKELFDWLGY